MALLAFTLALAAPLTPPDHVGRIYSYVRSNMDGSEAEHVHVYRASRTRIEVAKMRRRCTNAAFVTAELGLARGEATRLVAGRLRPDARHEEFGLLAFDEAAAGSMRWSPCRRACSGIRSPSGSAMAPL